MQIKPNAGPADSFDAFSRIHIQSLSGLAASLIELRSAMQSLAKSGATIVLGDPARTFDQQELLSFVRHLNLLLDVRTRRYRQNGLLRMKQGVKPPNMSSVKSVDGGPLLRSLGRDRTQVKPAREDGDSSNCDAPDTTHIHRLALSRKPTDALSVAETKLLLQNVAPGDAVEVDSLLDIFISIRRLTEVLHLLQVEHVQLVCVTENLDTRHDRDAKFFSNVKLIDTFDRAVNRVIGGQNQRLAAASGRQSGPRPKLNEADVERVRGLYQAGALTVGEIARQFSVSRGTVYRALEAPTADLETAAEPRKRRSPAVPRGSYQGERGDRK